MVRVIVAKAQLYISCLDPYCTETSQDIFKQLEDCKNIFFLILIATHFSSSIATVLHIELSSGLKLSNKLTCLKRQCHLQYMLEIAAVSCLLPSVMQHKATDIWKTSARVGDQQVSKEKMSLKHPCFLLTNMHVNAPIQMNRVNPSSKQRNTKIRETTNKQQLK